MSFEPIENYGLISDCHGAALISHRGSIDWLCLEKFDADPTCWRILDEDGAHLTCSLSPDFAWERKYLKDTNILITTAKNKSGLIRFTDFMPVGRVSGSSVHDYTNLTALHGVVRKIEVEGEISSIDISVNKAYWPASSKEPFHLYVVDEKMEEIKHERCTLKLKDKSLFLVISSTPLFNLTTSTLNTLYDVTKSFWEEWVAYSLYRGPYSELIKRSALVLKMLIYAPSGAIMAAPTTSLPEGIGGERNWDYRFCWLRDATFTLYALGYTGYSGEADAFSGYLKKTICLNKSPLQILYGACGESRTDEKIIEEVSGYMGSRPVRIGNDAYKQGQLDAFGDFLDWAYLHKTLGGKLDDIVLNKIRSTAHEVMRIWRSKDHGIWEVRGDKEDFTYSKVMCWVTLDRAGSILDCQDQYEQTKGEIEKFILEKCVKNGRLMRSAQSEDLDASLLLIRIVGYPIADDIYQNTVNAIQAELADGPFVRRYNSKDGLKGSEGSFIICSFWLVNALLFMDRLEEAEEKFRKLSECFNDLGLLGEEVDPKTGKFLGNFPQALSHLAFIETASYFDLYHRHGTEGLNGCHSDRVRKLHRTLHGPRAIFDFLIKTGNFTKLLPSYKSILNWIS